MSEDVEAALQAQLEHAASQKRTWQDDGPVLRNSKRVKADDFHWGIIETVVWIATRDMASVEGALHSARHGPIKPYDHAAPIDLGAAAKLVLNDLLQRDVSGHARACPTSDDDLPCECESLGRIRFCRCADRELSWSLTCACVVNAKTDLIAAIHDGLTVYGRRDGDREHVEVPRAALAGLSLTFPADGVRLLESFARVSMSVAAVKARWPADFSDRPLAMPGNVSPQQRALNALTSCVGPGRPKAWPYGLKIYCDRLEAGIVMGQQSDEAAEIRSNWPKPMKDGDPAIPSKKVAAEWVAKFHRQLRWDQGKVTNGSDVAASVVAHMKSEVAKSTAGRR